MIIFKEIKTTNNSVVANIIFENEHGKTVNIPIPENIAHHISLYLENLKTPPDTTSKIQNIE